MNEYVFSVPDVSCGHCKNRIEQNLKERGDVQSVEVDLDSKTVRISGSASKQQLAVLLDDIGYPVEE